MGSKEAVLSVSVTCGTEVARDEASIFHHVQRWISSLRRSEKVVKR